MHLRLWNMMLQMQIDTSSVGVLASCQARGAQKLECPELIDIPRRGIREDVVMSCVLDAFAHDV